MKAEEWMTVLLLLLSISNAVLSLDGEVFEVDSKNFHSAVESSSKFWVIKYYIPWCGFCLKFAPTFTALAKSTKNWEFIEYGQISCPSNTDLCSAHNSSKVPDVKLLFPTSGGLEIRPLMTGVSSLGTEEVLQQLLNNILDQLEDIQRSGSVSSKNPLPLLRQVRSFPDMQSNDGAKELFLIVEDDAPDELRTAELVILDLFKYRHIFKVFRTSVQSAQENLNAFQPGVYRLTKWSSFSKIESKPSRVGIRDAILSAIGDQGKDENEDSTSEKPELKPRVNNDTYVYRKAHGLHMADLITGLRYSLWTEIPMVSVMDIQARSALMNYLRILIKYHPADLQVIKFLGLLYDWLENHQSPITSKEWKNALASVETSDAYIPSNTTWKGCKGSEDYLRGYPCSLWMTFHALTVKAHLDHKDKENQGNAVEKNVGLEILMAVRGFIEHFFSCAECSRNFVYYSRSWLSQTEEDWPPKRAVLDLWRKHNSVNSRLHLQPQTEDPLHPKIQFPAVEDCQECRTKGQNPSTVFASTANDWDEENVFKFLVKYYSSAMLASCAEKGKTTYSSKWTACSATCGTGMSLRLTNDNKDCVLRIQTRLCYDRPCSLKFPDWTKSPFLRARCPEKGHTYRVNGPKEFRFLNCTAKVNTERRVCGLCPARFSSRRPVCCRPSISRTEYLDFKCANSVDDSPERDEDGVWLNKRNGKEVMIESTRIPIEAIDLCQCSEENCERM